MDLPELPSLNPLGKPIDGYVRVSRVGDRSGASYISPDLQRQAIEGWAKARGVELVMSAAEENVSGGTMDRPIFNAIMRRIMAGESGGIAVYKLDRFARTLVGGLTTLREITDRGAMFASVTESMYDLTTADGRMVLQFNLMMAEYFRERTTETWEASLTYAVGRGVHISPSVPYGYAKGDDKRLVPTSAATFVRRAFEMRAAGTPWQHIADWLNANAPARDDGHRWTAANVDRMTRRRAYLGIAHWGDVSNADAHEPLVDVALFDAAQSRGRGRHERTDADGPLLPGLVRCAGCRFVMSRALNTSGGRRRLYYRCRVTRVSGKCAAPASVRADRDDGLEAYVQRLVCAELDRRALAFDGRRDTGELDAATAQLQGASADVEDLRRDTFARRRLGDRWLSFLEPLLDAEDAARAHVRALRASLDAPMSGVASHEFSSWSRGERTEALRAMIDVVFVRAVGGPRGPQAVALDDCRVHVLWHGEAPAYLPLNNRVGRVEPWPWPDAEP